MEIRNNTGNSAQQAFQYTNMFSSLIGARRMIDLVGKQDGDGVVKIDDFGLPKEVRNKIFAGETYHNVPVAVYKCINLKKETALEIGCEDRYYSITAYKIK